MSSPGRALAMALGLAAAAATAQSVTQVELEQLPFDPAARGSLLVGNGQTLEGGGYRVSTALGYSHGQLRSQGGATLLRDRFVLHVLGAVGLTRWLELGADLPVVVSQSSEVARFAPNRAGLATPLLQVRLQLVDRNQLAAVSATFGVGVPVGTPGALGNGGLAGSVRLDMGRAFEAFQLGLQLGLLLRPQVSLGALTGNSNDRLGSQLSLAATATAVGDGLRGEVSARAFVSFAGGPPGLELLVGARYPLKDFEFFALLGPGIGGAPATPDFRLTLGLAFGNGGPPLGRCDERYDYPVADCPELDKDGDGVKNGVDLAPTEAEDKDGFQDEDGKPDPDNDQDGVLDVEDECPNEAGPKSHRGCPLPPDAPPRPTSPDEPEDPPIEAPTH